MLEVKLLKVAHNGEEEALKLEPYMEWADVFATENLFMTESSAKEEERYFSSLSEDQRAKRLLELDKEKERLTESVLFGDHSRLYTIISEFLALTHVSNLFFLERFQDSIGDSKYWAARNRVDSYNNFERHSDSISQRLDDEVDKLVELDFSKVFEIGFNTSYAIFRETDERDMEIARNIDLAENYLRSTYSGTLGKKEVINMIALVGSFHFPERHIKSSRVQVINLNEGDLERELFPDIEIFDTSYYFGCKDVEEARDRQLRTVAYIMFESDVLEIQKRDIARFSFNELFEIVEESYGHL